MTEGGGTAAPRQDLPPGNTLTLGHDRAPDPQDVSPSGEPLSVEESEIADDPRVTGLEPSTTSASKRDWLDALTAWSAVRNAHRHNCQLIVESDDGTKQYLPKLPDGALRDDRSVNVSIAFGAMDVAPTIELKVVVYRPHHKLRTVIIHSGRVRFAFGRLIRPKTDSAESIGEAFDAERGISNFSIDKTCYDNAILVSFEHGYGITHQMVPPADVAEQLVEKEVNVLQRLRDLARPSQRLTLKLRVLLSEKEQHLKAAGRPFDFIDFLEGVNSLTSIGLPPYAPYLSKQGFVHAAANSMKSLHLRLEAGSPHMPVKVYAALLDPIEAEVQTTFDADSEWTEQLTLLKQLQDNQHWVRFARFGKNVVALLRIRDRQKLFDAKYLLEAGTELTLQWSSPYHVKDQSALFFVMDDVLAFPEADLVLLAKNKTVGYFGPDAAFPHQVADRRFFKTRLEVFVNDATYRRRIDAAHLVWDARTGRQDLWPLLLNNAPGELPIINPFELAGIDTKVVDRVLAAAGTHLMQPLNSEQTQAVRGMRSLVGGIQIVQAPAGMGKTTTECIMAHVYHKLDICTVLAAPTNAAVDVMCQEYRKLFPNSQQPVRILASDRDLEDEVLGRSSKRHDEETGTTVEEIVMMEFLSDLKESLGNKGILGNDILSRTLQVARTGEFEVWRTYTNGFNKHTQTPIPDGEQINMCVALKEFFTKSTDPTELPFDEWEEDDKRRYRQALQFVKEEVLFRAPLIACTTSSCAQKLVRRCAGHNFKGLAVTIDEASRDRELDTYIPLVKFEKTPVAVHLFGDIKQGLPVHMSNTSRTGYNEFSERGRMPLMNRLIQQGFPYVALKRQYRMHHSIFQYPNKRYYDSALITDSAANISLDDNLASTLRAILGFEETEPQEYLRLQYVKIRDSEVRTSTASHSRANLEHLEWIVDVVSKLQLVFGNRTNKEVLIATPYRRQAQEYRKVLLEVYRERVTKDPTKTVDYSELANIRTVDSAQGTEATVVILDLVNTKADKRGDIGHMIDEHRACVAFTRAKQVLWIIGGAFHGVVGELRTREKAEKDDPMKPNARTRLCSVLEYKRVLTQASKYHEVEKVTIKRPIPRDLDPEYAHAPIDEESGTVLPLKACNICKKDVANSEHFVCFKCQGNGKDGYIVCADCNEGGVTCLVDTHFIQLIKKTGADEDGEKEADGGWGGVGGDNADGKEAGGGWGDGGNAGEGSSAWGASAGGGDSAGEGFSSWGASTAGGGENAW